MPREEEFPDPELLDGMTQDEIDGHILSFIKYTNGNFRYTELTGIQLGFENGYTSPFFDAQDYNPEFTRVNKLEFDTSKEIRYVTMLVNSGVWYYGIAFYDDDYQPIV